MSLLWSGGDPPEVVTGRRLLALVGIVLLFAYGAWVWVSRALGI